MSAIGAASAAADTHHLRGAFNNRSIPTFPSSLPIESLELPSRAYNALRAGGIATLQDASYWSERDLRSLPQMGPAAVRILCDALAHAGLALQPRTGRRKRL